MARYVPFLAVVALASTMYGAVNGQIEDPCKNGIDLGIIVDRSQSVGKSNFTFLKKAVKSFLDNFTITSKATHTSLIFFADKAVQLFNLRDSAYHSNQAVKNRIDSVSGSLFPGNRADLALMKAHDELFHPGQDRKNRPNVLVVFTYRNTAAESAPYSETVPPLEDIGTHIIAVGIGNQIDIKELEKIRGERGSAIQFSGFESLLAKPNDIVAEICVINGGYTHWSEWSECSASCGDGTRMRFRNCTNPKPMRGGSNCDNIGPAKEFEACDLPNCVDSIDGGYSRWTSWTQCSDNCGGGMRVRFRSCTNPSPFGNGKTCDYIGEPQETIACNIKKCVSSPCSKGIDLGILIDRSNSILKSNVQRLLKVFMPSFLQKFKISKKRTHIGVIMYDKSAKVLAPFNGPRSNNKGKAKAFIRNLDPSTATHTRTDKGLVSAYDQLFNRKKGDRSKKRNVLITFTDGRAWPRSRIRPFSKTVPPLKIRKKCHMVAVGYGVPSKINMTQLREIGGDHVVKISNSLKIKSYVNKIKNAVCRIDGGYSEWSVWSLCSTTCGAGVKVRSRVCNSPVPARGAEDCNRLGSPYETYECNEGECPKAPSPCKTKKQDVCLIVDESLSVKVPNYVRMKTFLTQFIYQFDPHTHFSIITFAGKANVRCKFSDKRCQTADGTYDLISEIPDKLFYGTYTDKALIAANEIVFTPENGDRADAKNVVIVITDGKTMKGAAPFNVTVPPLRDGKNAKMIAFGIGPSIREQDLNEIAGEKNWFYVDDFAYMKERIPDLLKTACTETTL